MASFVSTASSTAKSGQPHPDLAEQCRDRMIPIVLHATNEATASAIRSPNGVVPGLRGNDLLLETRQQPLPFGQGQPQIGDLNQIIRPGDRRDIDGLFLTAGPGSPCVSVVAAWIESVIPRALEGTHGSL